jgi:hypothetical protein
MGVEIGIDIGGTFTDVVCRLPDGTVRIAKLPTTRNDPSRAVLAALQMAQAQWCVDPAAISRLVHGTTVATNAVLERKGARIGLITTEGFRDVLEIGRQMRHQMYDLVLRPETPVFLAPGRYRKEVCERLDAHGNVLIPLGEPSVRQAIAELTDVQAIAVCLLFSFLDPAHERRIRDIIAETCPGLPVSLSSDVDPAFREYERTCVTAFDAYIKPVVADYLANMEAGLHAARRSRTAAGDAVPRRVDVIRHRTSATSPVVPVRPRSRGGWRRGSGTSRRVRRSHYGRHRRNVLRHRPGNRRRTATARRGADRRLHGARADGRCNCDWFRRWFDRLAGRRGIVACRATLRWV